MTRYAVWRRRPEDSRSAWRWIFRRKFRLVASTRKHIESRLILGALATIFLWAPAIAKGKPIDFDAFLTILIVASAFFKTQRVDAGAHAALPTLTVPPSSLKLFPVAMSIQAKGGLKGRERGWLSIADGWLVYEGLRTTVMLKPSSATQVEVRLEGSSLRLTDGRRVEFQLFDDASQTSLPALRTQRNELAETIRRWHRGFSPEGIAIDPPFDRHPEVTSDIAGRAFLGLAACLPFAILASIAKAPVWALLFALLALGFLLRLGWSLIVLRHELATTLVDDAALPWIERRREWRARPGLATRNS